MRSVPEPMPGDRPLNHPETVQLDPGEKATVTYTAKKRTDGGFVLPILAMSKHPDSVYKAMTDSDNVIYPEASVPPTDVDDKAVTFVPAYEFEQELVVQMTNLSDSTREYTSQPIGFEKVGENRAD